MLLVQVTRRQKTPQKQDGRVDEMVNLPAAAAMVQPDALIVTDSLPSGSAVASPSVAVAATAAESTELLIDGLSCTASASAAPDADASTKSKTPHTKKSRSRIAANFGALHSPS